MELYNLVNIINGVDDNPKDAALDKACQITTLLGI
ncbi:hypothetical protein L195_g046098, partial [Trifolium pratense]